MKYRLMSAACSAGCLLSLVLCALVDRESPWALLNLVSSAAFMVSGWIILIGGQVIEGER